MDRKEAIDVIRKNYPHVTSSSSKFETALRTLIPELKEDSEDERIRKSIINLVIKSAQNGGMALHKWESQQMITWLEKQGKQPICKTPSREIILAIWDLGNEWKELTKGSISTEYGTQLDYIQKHWRESEYYLRAKQSEQKPYGQRAECLDCQFNYAGECKGSCATKRIEQKPAEWSEEDERKYEYIRGCIYHCCVLADAEYLCNWLETHLSK